MRITLDLDRLLQDRRISAEEVEHLKSLAGPKPPQHPIRGLGSVAVWAVAGLVLGGLFGATVLSLGVFARLATNDPTVTPGLAYGSLTGLLVGAAGGAFAWAFLPYPGER
jgi:hypothetical protein